MAVSDERLTQGPIAKNLILFALPVLGTNALQSLSTFVNALWIGRYLGDAGLAAIANANLILFLLLGTVFGMCMAATVMVGQAIGARNPDQARRVVGSGIGFLLVISSSIGVGGYLGTDLILGLLKTPTSAMPLARAYLEIIFLAIPVINMLTFVSMVLRGAGDSRTPLQSMAAAVLLHIILNPILILGWGPIPRMDTAGSALATLLSQLLALIGTVLYLYWRGHVLTLGRADAHYLRPSAPILKALMLKGIPMGLQAMVISLSALILIGMVNRYGTEATAAYGVVAQLSMVVHMPAIAAGAAVSTMVAQNVGAGLWDRVDRITRAGVYFNILTTGLVVMLFLIFDRYLIGLFLPADSESATLAAHINKIILWSYIFMGIALVQFGAVRSTGAVMAPLLFMIVALMGVRISFASWLQPLLGADAIWWSLPIGGIVLAAFATLYYRLGQWRSARMLSVPVIVAEETNPA